MLGQLGQKQCLDVTDVIRAITKLLFELRYDALMFGLLSNEGNYLAVCAFMMRLKRNDDSCSMIFLDFNNAGKNECTKFTPC